MTFLQLWDDNLDIELASSDTTQLFTTTRRKAAVNAAVLAFVRLTDCVKKYSSITVVDGTGEYDLEAEFTDFLRLQGDPSVKIVSGSTTTYIQGEDLPFKEVDQLDIEDPGWRATDASTPKAWYLRYDGGATYLGLYPPPDISGSDTWTILVPYTPVPTDMSGSTDEPFTFSSNIPIRLRPYHQGLVHYAAAQLEPLRKNYSGAQRQMTLFNGFVAAYLEDERRNGGDQITMARDYYGESRSSRPMDPRRWP